MISQTYDRRKAPNGAWIMEDPHWRVEEIEPPTEWLDACAPRAAITSIIPAIALVQFHLLALIIQEGDIDGLRACVILHHLTLYGTGWSAPVKRLASRLGVVLPDNPWDATHGAGLDRPPSPRRPPPGRV